MEYLSTLLSQTLERRNAATTYTAWLHYDAMLDSIVEEMETLSA